MKKTVCDLDYVDMSKPLPVLWLGNGLNRTFEGDSWEKLIMNAAKKCDNKLSFDEIKHLPSNMQIVAATNNNVDEEMKSIAEEMKQQGNDIELQNFIQENIVLQNFHAIITTNYTYEIEKALEPQYSIYPANSHRKISEDVKDSERRNMLYSFNNFVLDQHKINIWHIHGEACSPKTMIMDNYYYGTRLSKIQTYISKRMPVLKPAYREKLIFQPKSWIDYFLLGEVYVCGFGLDLSELDFWWLVCCKKKHFPDTKITIYEPDIKPEIKWMLDAYDVEVRTCNSTNKKSFYKEYHKKVFQEICDINS